MATDAPTGPPDAPMVYVVRRFDGKFLAVAPTRHEAMAAISQLHGGTDWNEVLHLPMGMLPALDIHDGWQSRD